MRVGRERVLVTGASGFLGACLARQLVTAAEDVHLLLRPESQTWRLRGVAESCTIHRADLRDAAALRQAVAACRPDLIYHLAAQGTWFHQQERAAILATNLLGTANLLDALDGHAYRTLVNVGSSSEYGHKDGPIRASDRLEPRNDYAVAKAAATLLCQAEVFKQRSVVTVRVFSAYGPWEDATRIASYVMGCCLRGEVPLVTSGWQPRDFIYADDVVDLLRAAALEPRAQGHILHAGTGRRQTVRDLVETILTVCTGNRLAAEYGARTPRPDEPAAWVADITQTTALTGWRPRHDLPSGVERMWAWFRTSAGSRAA